MYRLEDDLEGFLDLKIIADWEAFDEGIVAFGGNLNTMTLLNAYIQGVFPWYIEGEPILWWCPPQRAVLFLQDFKVSKSLAKTLRHKGYEVRFNTSFDAVIKACQTTKRRTQTQGESSTWIDDAMLKAYTRLHHLGYAYSVETYHEGVLVGGLYGVYLQGVFSGESMFAHKSDASKVALWHLVKALEKTGVGFIDCQIQNPHLERLGVCEIDRQDFFRLLKATQGNTDLLDLRDCF